MVEHLFHAALWEHAPADPGSWHFLTVPPDVSDAIDDEAGPRGGFGSVRVRVRIGTTTWLTSVFPDAGRGAFVLPVKKDVRRAEDLAAGTLCDVVLEVVARGS